MQLIVLQAEGATDGGVILSGQQPQQEHREQQLNLRVQVIPSIDKVCIPTPSSGDDPPGPKGGSASVSYEVRLQLSYPYPVSQRVLTHDVHTKICQLMSIPSASVGRSPNNTWQCWYGCCAQVPQQEWDAVVCAQSEVNPFLKWSFLNALEASSSVVSVVHRTGPLREWQLHSIPGMPGFCHLMIHRMCGWHRQLLQACHYSMHAQLQQLARLYAD